MLLTVLGLLLAIGRFLPVFPLIMSVPPFGLFRCPNRYNLLVHFGLSILAACALACLLEPKRRLGPLPKSARVFISIVFSMALLPLLYSIWLSVNPQNWLSSNVNSPYMAAIGSCFLRAGAYW